VAYNNRAMAAIKLEKYSDAVNDCNCVLKMDPDNVKGTVCLLHSSIVDIEYVLKLSTHQ
jgi:hypothetical protein